MIQKRELPEELTVARQRSDDAVTFDAGLTVNDRKALVSGCALAREDPTRREVHLRHPRRDLREFTVGAFLEQSNRADRIKELTALSGEFEHGPAPFTFDPGHRQHELRSLPRQRTDTRLR